MFLDKLKKKELPKPFTGKFEPNITANVRVSSNPFDTDLDIIMLKLMKNRILHKTFNSMLSKEQTRYYIRDLIFQNSELQPYLNYLHDDSHFLKEGSQEEVVKKGGNIKDLARAQWLFHELNSKPYIGFDQTNEEDDPVCDPELLKKP